MAKRKSSNGGRGGPRSAKDTNVLMDRVKSILKTKIAEGFDLTKLPHLTEAEIAQLSVAASILLHLSLILDARCGDGKARKSRGLLKKRLKMMAVLKNRIQYESSDPKRTRRLNAAERDLMSRISLDTLLQRAFQTYPRN